MGKDVLQLKIYTVRVMVDVVNTSVQATAAVSAVDLRAVQEQASERRDVVAARQAETESKTLQAPFISPAIHVDVNFNKAVIQIRDSETGDVQETIPSESDLQRKARIEESREKSPADDVAASRKSGVETDPRVNVISSTSSAPAPEVTESTTATVEISTQQVSAEQIAAFESAARSGDSSAGTVSIFA